MSREPRLTIAVVTHHHGAAITALLEALGPQLEAGDEVVVVDNASADGSADVAERLGARVIRNARNAGFASACAQAGEAATGELLVLLNPDCVPERGFARAIRAPWGGPWGAWQGMVLDGERVNTSGGVVHFTGLAWAGEAGAPAPAPDEAGDPREVGFASGACLAIPLAAWRELGGFAPSFFMYHEDVDLSLRLRLSGRPVGVAPAARVDHDYRFAKGGAKWRRLEANRWATILRCYPGPLLALALPALLALELVLWPVALAGGWLPAKALATTDVLRRLPALLGERRTIQSSRTASARVFAEGLTSELSSPYLGGLARSRVVRWGMRAYWRAVLALLRA